MDRLRLESDCSWVLPDRTSHERAGIDPGTQAAGLSCFAAGPRSRGAIEGDAALEADLPLRTHELGARENARLGILGRLPALAYGAGLDSAASAPPVPSRVRKLPPSPASRRGRSTHATWRMAGATRKDFRVLLRTSAAMARQEWMRAGGQTGRAPRQKTAASRTKHRSMRPRLARVR